MGRTGSEIGSGLQARKKSDLRFLLSCRPRDSQRWSTAGEGKAETIRDAFLEEVRRALVETGLRVWPAFSIAGLTVDLVVETKRGTIGIDLVGYPGRFAGSFPLERYRMLQRAGLRALPLPHSDWRRDPKGTLQALLSFGEVKP